MVVDHDVEVPHFVDGILTCQQVTYDEKLEKPISNTTSYVSNGAEPSSGAIHCASVAISDCTFCFDLGEKRDGRSDQF